MTVRPTQCLDEILIPQVMEKALGKLDLTVPEPWNPLELWNCPQLAVPARRGLAGPEIVLQVG